MPVFTRRWSNESRDTVAGERDALGITATSATVSGTVEWDAYDPTFTSAAAVRSHAEFPVAINMQHPDEAGLILCRQYAIKRVGLRLWRVIAQFESPPPGEDGHGAEEDDDPVSQPPQFQWDDIDYTEPVDRDVNGNAIVNSAKQWFANPTSRNFKAFRLTIAVNEASYNPNIALAYVNHVNSDEFQGAAPQEVRCLSIIPTNVYTATTSYINIAYSFEFRSIDIWGEKPHQPRIKDQGRMGWADVDGANQRVRICTKNGQVVSDDEPLNGHGAPYDQDMTYLDGGDEPVESPSWVSIPTPPGATIEDTGVAVFLRYDVYPETSFGGLNLG